MSACDLPARQGPPNLEIKNPHAKKFVGALMIALHREYDDWTRCIEWADEWAASEPPDAPLADVARSAMCRTHRNMGPMLLHEWWQRAVLDRGALRSLIIEVWCSAECPHRSTIGERAWLRLLEDAGYVTDGPPIPTEPVKLYRAAIPSRTLGMSWTTDSGVALRFTGYITRLPGVVWQATVPPKAVLARIERCDEAEVIVNPRCLRGRATPRLAPDDLQPLQMLRSTERSLVHLESDPLTNALLSRSRSFVGSLRAE